MSKEHPVPRSDRSILLAVGIVILSASQSFGQQICKPRLWLEDVRLSPTPDLQRRWTAVVSAEASRCATPHGRFVIDFIRVKENAPDAAFSEPFTWRAGEGVEVATNFSADEAPLTFSLGRVEPCTCRE